MMESLIIGTRGSALALWQANWVRSAILNRFPEVSVELEIIKTKGDAFLNAPLAEIGGKGLFVKEIEQALLDKRIDIAVHSMKDMPGEIPAGLKIGAVPKRENPYDALISAHRLAFSELPKSAVIGTGSLRRGCQLLHGAGARRRRGGGVVCVGHGWSSWLGGTLVGVSVLACVVGVRRHSAECEGIPRNANAFRSGSGRGGLGYGL